MDFNLNRRANALVDRIEADASTLAVSVSRLANGARVVDCGIEARGGLEAGRLFAEVCLGGLGQVGFGSLTFGEWWTPSVTVRTDHPAVACMAAQYAGWHVKHGDFFAMGSGPARALARVEEKLYDDLGYREESDVAVLCLETRSLPTAEVADYVAERAGVRPEALTLLVAPTASLAASVQVAARVVETALHKLHTLEFDLRQVLSAMGDCPLPPVAKSDPRAIGRTNDAVLYGGRVALMMEADDAVLEGLINQMPASASADYGQPCYEVLKRSNFDFYAIDPHLFSPAEVAISNVPSGRTFRAGRVNVEVLRRSFFEA